MLTHRHRSDLIAGARGCGLLEDFSDFFLELAAIIPYLVIVKSVRQCLKSGNEEKITCLT